MRPGIFQLQTAPALIDRLDSISMHTSTTKRLAVTSFWLSLILHLLLLFSIIALITAPEPPEKTLEKKEKMPTDFVPAYTYTGSIKPSLQSRPAQKREKK